MGPAVGTAAAAGVGAGTAVGQGQRFLLVAELAELVNPASGVVSMNTLYRMIQAAELPAIKVGDRRKYVVPAAAVDVVVARVLGEAPPASVGLARDPAPAAPSGQPKVLSVPAAARLLRVCRATLERAYLAGQFPVVRFGGRVTVPTRAIDEMEAAALKSGGLVYAADWCAAARDDVPAALVVPSRSDEAVA